MKKLLFIFIGMLYFYSCSDSENLTNKNEQEEFNLNYAQIGEAHNAGLDYVFSRLKLPTKVTTRTNQDSYVDLVEQEELIQDVNTLCTEYVTEQIKNCDSATQNAFLLYGGEAKFKEDIEIVSIKEIEMKDLEANISSTANEYVNRLDILLNNTSISIDNLQLQLNQMESEIQNMLTSEKDKSIILSTISVAKSTSTYWNENGNKWGEMCGHKDYKLIGSTRSSIWRSDAFGAAGFGLHMWINGTAGAIISTGPSGWIAMGLILGGAALESSAIAFLCEMKYIDRTPNNDIKIVDDFIIHKKH